MSHSIHELKTQHDVHVVSAIYKILVLHTEVMHELEKLSHHFLPTDHSSQHSSHDKLEHNALQTVHELIEQVMHEEHGHGSVHNNTVVGILHIHIGKHEHLFELHITADNQVHIKPVLHSHVSHNDHMHMKHFKSHFHIHFDTSHSTSHEEHHHFHLANDHCKTEDHADIEKTESDA